MMASSVQDLSVELKVLHKALLNAGQAAYEVEHGPIAAGMQLLQLVVHDPAFAWLRPLSEMMADFDALLDLGAPRPKRSKAPFAARSITSCRPPGAICGPP